MCFMSLVEELKPKNVKIIENPKHIQISNFLKNALYSRCARKLLSIILTVLFLMCVEWFLMNFMQICSC